MSFDPTTYDPLSRLDIAPGKGRPLRAIFDTWKADQPMSEEERARLTVARQNPDWGELLSRAPGQASGAPAPPAPEQIPNGIAFDASKLSEAEWVKWRQEHGL